jgi:hypothetical protein
MSRVLMGDYNSCLIELKVDTKTKEIMHKHVYHDLKIKLIWNITQLGNLAVIGESKDSDSSDNKNALIKVINLQNKEELPETIETAVTKFITSLKFWRKSMSELVLDVSGGGLDYSPNKSTLFDLNKAIQNKLITSSQGISKDILIKQQGKTV